MSAAGFPVTKEQVIARVTEIVRKLGRPNRFKDGVPGRSWWVGFRKRHPNLLIQVPQNLTAPRAAIISETGNGPDECFLRKLNDAIGPTKLELFRNWRKEGRTADMGDDTSLFNLWNRLQENSPAAEDSSLLHEDSLHSPLDLFDNQQKLSVSHEREDERGVQSERNPSPEPCNDEGGNLHM